VDWLNYHHLHYFWTVAREGSIARASEKLRLAQPTISAQIRTLEDALGESLFERRGRGLVLTDVGRVVLGYADEIFAVGRELLTAVRQGRSDRPQRLVLGVTDAVPKSVTREVLRPAFRLDPPAQVIVREGKLEALVADLAVHRLDLVLSDHTYRTPSALRIFHHALGECGVTFFAEPKLAARLRRGFPGSLDGAPAMLPTDNTALRGSLDEWFARIGVRPKLVAEFEDSALMKVVASGEPAVFPVPSVAVEEISRAYGVRPVGATDACRESFWAISAERRLKHPAVVEITEKARTILFA